MMSGPETYVAIVQTHQRQPKSEVSPVLPHSTTDTHYALLLKTPMFLFNNQLHVLPFMHPTIHSYHKIITEIPGEGRGRWSRNKRCTVVVDPSATEKDSTTVH